MKMCYLPALLCLSLLLVSCKDKGRAEISKMKERAAGLVEEEATASRELSSLNSELSVFGRDAARVEAAAKQLTEKTTAQQRRLAGLEAVNESIREQTKQLQAAHEAYRKTNKPN